MRLTAIVANPRKPDRYRLDLPGAPSLVADSALVAGLDLHAGDNLEATTLRRLRAGAARLRAFDKAVEALARRARARRELERWLAQRGHGRSDITAAVERLTALGLLDDAEFARAFARSRAVGRGYSRWRLRAELARRGVERAIADAAIDEALADEAVEESAIVETVANKKLRTLAKLADATRRRRLYAFLARRGYDADVVRATVDRLTRS